MLPSAYTLLCLGLLVGSGLAQDLSLSFPDPTPTSNEPSGPTMTITPVSTAPVSCGPMDIGLGSNIVGITPDDTVGIWIITTTDPNRAIVGHPTKRDNVTTSIGTTRLADSFYTWEEITVSGGWYVLNSQVLNGENVGIEAWSNPFRITEGPNTSCLPVSAPPASSTGGSSSPPTTGTGTTSPSPTQSTSTPPLPPPAGGHKTNAGTIAGPVVGALAVVALAFLGAFFLRRRLAKKRISEKSVEDPFVDPAPRPSTSNWAAPGNGTSQPSPRLRHSFGPTIGVTRTSDDTEEHNMKDMESQDTVAPLSQSRNSASSFQVLASQRTGASTETVASSELLPPLIIPSGRASPSLPRSAADSDSGSSNATRSAPSANVTPIRPSRKPVPAYLAPDNGSVLPSQLQESFAKSLADTLVFTPPSAKRSSKSPVAPMPSEDALGLVGQNGGPVHYLIPDPPSAPRD